MSYIDRFRNNKSAAAGEYTRQELLADDGKAQAFLQALRKEFGDAGQSLPAVEEAVDWEIGEYKKQHKKTDPAELFGIASAAEASLLALRHLLGAVKNIDLAQDRKTITDSVKSTVYSYLSDLRQCYNDGKRDWDKAPKFQDFLQGVTFKRVGEAIRGSAVSRVGGKAENRTA